MSKRFIQVDPTEARKRQYRSMEDTAMSAIWEALEKLADQGIDIGPKAAAIIATRKLIRAKAPNL